ncbi:MAG TPA: DUF748 domain-containing protein [Opitutaceae bacterium]|nr:DUF748 domain-containing protein [Opitutaceae bacterium]
MPTLKAWLQSCVHLVRRWPRWVVVTIAIVAGLLLAARIALPIVLTSAVNHRLQKIEGYTGRVQDVDVHLWRGGYSMHGFEIMKQNGRLKEPFIWAREIDFSLAWGELLRGRFVSRVRIAVGQLTFVAGPDAEQSQTDLDGRWQDVIEALFPIDITHLEITDGLLRYINTKREPMVDLFITRMHLVGTGLRNRRSGEDGDEFPASIRAVGDSVGDGRLEIELDAEPLAQEPHFHLRLKLDAVHLPALNETLRAYANVDVSRGTFRLAGEMAANDGGFRGYVKPFFEDLDFASLPHEEESIGRRIWETVVSFMTEIVKNKPRDQLATRIPFEGRFGDAKVSVLTTIGNVFRHGFVQAFDPTVENSVDPEAVEPTGEVAPLEESREKSRADAAAEMKP